ncbi:sugar-phosphatase [Limosilactobacillus fastidiosus]|uniref:Sugar-phosphatase n=1 Tax=Limosilactobacillus fastidiosus TaxID=2759855 RepID=A0A7W3YCY1_9LACO|nr:sugar-phosphatase [Limosilactobacillus fastidiosus]MBB1086596.1 sugar-phosphatase [Limosilactobacillus fastidiosus]MCD7086572.1 sugar-phosphatase [Limosilactobacillus fastidiosus]MCD7115280.1 sugar-phosphatase [Limosilactobacillus fastidiosus]MCD7116937.1 sugar-phosphatase [Limosilactobacillus fastidiosus]
MAIKLVAIDIDATLINDQRQITLKTKRVLEAARQQGVKIVLCTGRPMTGVDAYLTELGLNHQDEEYVISFNGALAQSTNERVMVNYTLTFDDYIDWQAFCTKNDVKSQFESRNYIYTTNRDLSPWTIHESDLVSMPVRIRSLDELAHMQDQYVIAKGMMLGDKEKLDQIQNKFIKRFGNRFTVIRSENFYLEIVNHRASKGSTLKALSDELGIKQDEVMALGNAQNDNSMIKYAGIGVAMGNAIPETKAVADVITDTNNNDGVGKAIEKYVLR